MYKRVRKMKKNQCLFIVVLFFLLIVSCQGINIYKVKRIVDGDTIVLNNDKRVRYIGIDTPETKHPRKGIEYFGKEASEANKKLVEGKRVRLEYDVQRTDK